MQKFLRNNRQKHSYVQVKAGKIYTILRDLTQSNRIRSNPIESNSIELNTINQSQRFEKYNYFALFCRILFDSVVIGRYSVQSGSIRFNLFHLKIFIFDFFNSSALDLFSLVLHGFTSIQSTCKRRNPYKMDRNYPEAPSIRLWDGVLFIVRGSFW